ncbi:proteophosphoglycan ppg4 [Rhodotorula toruloides]|uniref:Proteophosphoglycan ppg4 n=1 Tax=Rhodotorula toruloides TaxID=5286 RepID=A0A511KMM1_RHOTO|nr:proteophosphoglycan ppg4 [Rhodotorula toruloides]
MGAILDLSYRLLLVSGIAPHARERDLRDSIDLVVGRGSVKALRISIGAGSDRNRTATIEMDRHSDASRVLDRVDGALFEGQALTVNWVHTSSTGERAAGVDDKIGLVPPAPTSHALPPASPSQPPPSPMQKKVLLAANGGAVHAAKNLSRSKGLDALRYLGLPQPDLDAISHMWAPLDEAPPNKNDKAFDRHLRTKVKFGFVPQQDAEASLQDERMRTAFKDDPVLQHRFEVFLAAQAGRSKEWYLTFFAHIAEFNRLSRLFSETARRRWHSA